MLLLVGLGNPGAEYALNRHNLGFLVLDAIVEDYGFSPWRTKFQAWISEGKLGGEKVLALKPQTFMNRSGDAVSAAVRFFKLEPSDVLVVHDELDLAPAKVKVKTGGGTAGHNGLKDIGSHIGPDFRRVRIGIGHPGSKDRVHRYILGNFSMADQEWVADVVGAIVGAAPLLAKGEDARFMSDVAMQMAPQDQQNKQDKSDDGI